MDLPFIVKIGTPVEGEFCWLLITNSLHASQMLSPFNLELVSAHIHEPKPFIICIIYSYYLTELCKETCPIVLIGDFNFPDIDWATLSDTSSISNRFCDLLFQLNRWTYMYILKAIFSTWSLYKLCRPEFWRLSWADFMRSKVWSVEWCLYFLLSVRRHLVWY